MEASSSTLTGLVNKSIELKFVVIQAAPLIEPSDVEWQFVPSSASQTQVTLTAGPRHAFSSDRLTLTITNITFNDDGQYTVSTTNRNGIDTASIALTIDGKVALISLRSTILM